MKDQVPGVFHVTVDSGHDGKRLDVYVAELGHGLTRNQATRLIREGEILLGGEAQKPNHKVRAGDAIEIRLPEARPVAILPQAIPLAILFEDADIVVVNKAPGLVVHPAPGHPDGTLVNALLHHCPDLGGIGGEIRPGIVHRLDMDTSGALVVAKHQVALERLQAAFQDRTIRKEYLALCHGNPKTDSGIIDLPIGRHPTDRKRMSTKSRQGRDALTHWRIEKRFRDLFLARIDLKTGRTHQIRVHMQALGYPLVGDPVYGPRRPENLLRGNPASSTIRQASRQMLHAETLSLAHPMTGKAMRFSAPLPCDMKDLLTRLVE